MGFLYRAAGSRLTSADIQQWHELLEGWPAGLQLAALSGQRPGGGAMGAADVSGRQRYIADYLAQEVLALLPDEVQDFLLRTSILDRLSAPLAEVVTATAGGQPMLERLERESLIVQALDDERIWFRYHPLFASFLQAELVQRHAGEAPGLHRRAAAWHLELDQAAAAFWHAVAGEDPERGTQAARQDWEMAAAVHDSAHRLSHARSCLENGRQGYDGQAIVRPRR